MRIIADIPHKKYKITVFKNAMKYSIQLEGKFVHLTFRLPEIHAFDSNEKVLAAIDKDLLKYALEAMHNEEISLGKVLQKYDEEEYYEPII